jgi:hypothetical protein
VNPGVWEKRYSVGGGTAIQIKLYEIFARFVLTGEIGGVTMARDETAAHEAIMLIRFDDSGCFGVARSSPR